MLLFSFPIPRLHCLINLFTHTFILSAMVYWAPNIRQALRCHSCNREKWQAWSLPSQWLHLLSVYHVADTVLDELYIISLIPKSTWGSNCSINEDSDKWRNLPMNTQLIITTAPFPTATPRILCAVGQTRNRQLKTQDAEMNEKEEWLNSPLPKPLTLCIG